MDLEEGKPFTPTKETKIQIFFLSAAFQKNLQ